MVSLFAWTIISILSAALSGALARAKGRPIRYWFCVGFFLGPLGLLAAAVMRSVKTPGHTDK